MKKGKQKPERMPSRIWSHLRRSGRSQKNVARLMGYRSASNLSRWINGTKMPTLINVFALAAALNTTVDALYPELRRYWEDIINSRRGLDFHHKTYPDIIHKRSMEIAKKGNQNKKLITL